MGGRRWTRRLRRKVGTWGRAAAMAEFAAVRVAAEFRTQERYCFAAGVWAVGDGGMGGEGGFAVEDQGDVA